MQKSRVVVTYKTFAGQKPLIHEILDSLGDVIFLEDIPQERRTEVLSQADMLFSWIFTRDIQPAEYPFLQQVRFLQLLSAGADTLPFQDLSSSMTLASNVGAYAVPMAEHVVAMTLALAKRLLATTQSLKQGVFDQSTMNRSLAGKTAGILGFGGIGRVTARFFRAFDMTIYAINHSGKSSEAVDFLGTLSDLETVLRKSDVVVLSLPLTQETRGLLGAEQLAWMKPESILVNVARGPILDEEALYRHLQSHPHFLAGLDAWWNEPALPAPFRPRYPFLDLPNVLGSPHNSAVVPGVFLSAARDAAENIKRMLLGEKVQGIVQREDYL